VILIVRAGRAETMQQLRQTAPLFAAFLQRRGAEFPRLRWELSGCGCEMTARLWHNEIFVFIFCASRAAISRPSDPFT
jgi:hypothetical protein